MPTDLRARTGLAYDDLPPRAAQDQALASAQPDVRRPILLVHAGICDRRMWNPQLELLAADRRVIRLDLRGFGTSDRKAPGAFAHHLEVAALLDELGVTAAHLVGVSMGAGVVAEVAVARPDLVRSLLLVAPSGALRTEVTADLEAFWEAEGEALAEEDLERAVEANLETWLDGPRQASDRVDAAIRTFVGQMQLKAFENTDGWDDEEIEGAGLEPAVGTRAAEIRVPTRILVGELDVVAVSQTATRLAGQIPGASLVCWPDVAHLPSLERPDEFGALALDWFSQVEADAKPA
ncbi:MAG: alpha/beta fold hydrolase [Candidatus Limnocylindrales bacterium]